jgi:hypothetical protein
MLRWLPGMRNGLVQVDGSNYSGVYVIALMEAGWGWLVGTAVCGCCSGPAEHAWVATRYALSTKPLRNSGYAAVGVSYGVYLAALMAAG